MENSRSDKDTDSEHSEDEFSDALDDVCSSGEKYVCSLDDKTVQKAYEELGEDPLTRMEHVKNLRQWLLDQQHVIAMTDTPVLLMFLRAAKFKQEKARQKIIGMLTLGKDRPSWFKDVDPQAEDILAVYNDLYVVPLPQKDEDGCTVVIYRMGSFDPSGARYTKSSIMKAFGALFIHLMKLEEAQVNGFVYIIDAADFNTRQQLFWTPNDLRTIARMWQVSSSYARGRTTQNYSKQKALPARFKRFHFVRMGLTFDIILRLLMPFLSTKFKERIILHGNDLSDLRKHISPDILPDEYLPEDYQGPSAGPMPQIIENLKLDLSSPTARDYIQSMTSSNFCIKEQNGHSSKSKWSRVRAWVGLN